MWFSWLSKLVNRQARTGHRDSRSMKRRSAFRPSFESLANRLVPTFLTPVSYAAGAAPAAIAVADYNGDGKADMAVVNNAVAGSVGIFLSNGDGTFQPQVDYAAGAYAIDAKAGD